MSTRLTKRLAILLLALLAFGQLNSVFAACVMERDESTPIAVVGEHDCAGCAVTAPLAALAASASPVAIEAPAPRARPAAPPVSSLKLLDRPPPAGPPLRILLHSFLV
jgi:hypothetical protein